MSNAVLERIHQVLGNLVQTFNIPNQTYVDENDLWKGILAAAAFEISHQIIGKKIIVLSN